MGLDQAIVKMSVESAEQIAKWEDGGRMGEFPDVKTDEVWTGRKENHIHRVVWTLTEVEPKNCGYVHLSKEVVNEMAVRLRAVLANHSLALELMPPQDGFFFGGTDLNEWYFKDLEQELADFTAILKDWDPESCYAYWAWW